MLNIIKKFLNRENVMIYLNDGEDENTFYYGTIIANDDNYTCFISINTEGKYNGIKIVETDRIVRISSGGMYEEKMRCLCENNIQKPSIFTVDSSDIILSVLNYLKKSKDLAEIKLSDINMYISGVVIDFDDDFCSLKEIDQYGQEDCDTYFSINSISTISFDSREQKKLKTFMEKT